jgi:hypothetical protein
LPRFSDRMQALRWSFERGVVVALHRPQHYIVALSVLVAGLFSSLPISGPVKAAIDRTGYLVDSDWLRLTAFTLIIWVAVNLGCKLLSKFFGLQPFEAIADAVSRTALIPDLDGAIERSLKRSGKSKEQPLAYQVRLVGPNEIELFDQLNREIFAFTTFAIPLRDIRQRNNSIYKVNPATSALVWAVGDGREAPVGISHILPLNELGGAMYVRNKGLSDSEITARDVAKRGEWSDTIILFSMGLTKSGRGRLRPTILSDVFIAHLLMLLVEIRAKNPSLPLTHIYAQTEKPSSGIGLLLQRYGFEQTSIVTGDGYTLWQADADLTRLPTPAIAG